MVMPYLPALPVISFPIRALVCVFYAMNNVIKYQIVRNVFIRNNTIGQNQVEICRLTGKVPNRIILGENMPSDDKDFFGEATLRNSRERGRLTIL